MKSATCLAFIIIVMIVIGAEFQMPILFSICLNCITNFLCFLCCTGFGATVTRRRYTVNSWTNVVSESLSDTSVLLSEKLKNAFCNVNGTLDLTPLAVASSKLVSLFIFHNSL